MIVFIDIVGSRVSSLQISIRILARTVAEIHQLLWAFGGEGAN